MVFPVSNSLAFLEQDRYISENYHLVKKVVKVHGK